MADRVLDSLIRMMGAHAWMAPRSIRRQLLFAGVTGHELRGVLSRVRCRADFAHSWAEEGKLRQSEGRYLAAAVAFSIAHRVENQDFARKRDWYLRSHAAYWDARHDVALELVEFNWLSGRASAVLQVPTQPAREVVVMLPGIGTTKEDLHHLAVPLLDRGVAVCRLDLPGCGATEGVLDERSPALIDALLAELATDPRLPASRPWLFGPSMGGFWALHALAEGVAAAGAVGLSAPIRPHRTLRRIPLAHVRALERCTGLAGTNLREMCERLDLFPRVSALRQPVLLFSGSRDEYVPAADAVSLARNVSAGEVVIHRGERHLCLPRYDVVVERAMDWIASRSLASAASAS